MKRLLLGALCAVFPLVADCALWESDFVQVLSEGEREGKPILLFFSASDWSAPSMKMQKEMLDHFSFREMTQGKFLFLQVDFPKHSAQPEEVVVQNKRLQELFHVGHLPCLVLIDQGQREVGRIDYLPESKEALAKQLLEWVAMDHQLSAAEVILGGKETLSGQRLRELYEMAMALGQQERAALFLERGLQSDCLAFFQLQLYQKLLQQGKYGSQEARILRKTILQNADEAQFHSLVVMEFQTLARGEKKSVGSVVAPLQEYLVKYGKKGGERVWRTEMMVAQVYMSYDEFQLAYDYAKRAYEKAPVEVQGEIATSLRYIEAQSLSVMK